MKSNKKALSTAAEPLKEGVMSTGIRCRPIVAVAVLLAFIFSSGVVSAQETVAGFVGGNIMKGLQSMGKARASTAKSSARIKKARAEYWAQFPDGPGLQEAQERFTELLVNKDLFYLTLHIDPLGLKGEKKTQAWVKNTAEKMGGAIDNGLWPGTEHKFYGWVRAFRNALKKDDPFMTKWTVNQKLADAAWEQSKEKYAAYKRARDCAELMAAMGGLSFKNTKELTLAIISLGKDFAEKQDVAERYRKMVVDFGKKELHTAAEEVRRAQKDQFGRIINPSALGPFGDWHPYWALRGPLSRNSGKSYAWIVLGEDKYKDWTAVIPERELIAAADRLRVMPHLTTGSFPWHLDIDSSVYQALPRKYHTSMGQPEATLERICGDPEDAGVKNRASETHVSVKKLFETAKNVALKLIGKSPGSKVLTEKKQEKKSIRPTDKRTLSTGDQAVTSDGSEEIKDYTMKIRISGSTEYAMTIKLKDFTKESKNPKGYRQGFFINFVLPSELNNSRIIALFFNDDSRDPSTYMYYPEFRRIRRYSKAQLENNKFGKTSLTLKEIFDTAVKLVYRDQVTVNGSTVSVINRKLGYIDPREFLLSNLQKNY
jgi:hypothetical protein